MADLDPDFLEELLIFWEADSKPLKPQKLGKPKTKHQDEEDDDE